MNAVRGFALNASRLVLGRLGGSVGLDLRQRMAASPLLFSARNFPVCSVLTNLNNDQVPKDFQKGLSKVIAETLIKPEQSISVTVSTNVRVCRSGSDDASVVIEIWSIGVFDEERNKKYTKDIFKYVTSQLKAIPADRIVLLFHPLKKEDAGHLTYKELK